MNHINIFKAAITSIVAGISAWLGWLGWLTVAFVMCMSVDWITGSAAAVKAGQWNSKTGREGLWHKTGSIIAVIVSALLDMVIGTVINNIPNITLPFSYTVLLCPIVIVWYILTEMGSIIENVGKIGAPVPKFLRRAILLFRETVDAAGDRILNDK